MNTEEKIKNNQPHEVSESKMGKSLTIVKKDSIIKNSKRNIIRFSLWIIVVILSLVFGITAILRAIGNINDIANAEHWYNGLLTTLSSIGNFLEAGLFIFFIVLATTKSIKYWTLWKEYLTLNKNEKEIKKVKEISKKTKSDVKDKKLESNKIKEEPNNKLEIEELDDNFDEFKN